MSQLNLAASLPSTVVGDDLTVISLHRSRRKLLTVGGVVALALAAIVAAAVGGVPIPATTIAKIMLSRLPFVSVVADWPASYEAVLWQIRLPRVLLAALVGASLGVSGATYQGLFRNPLADPYLIGVAAGAALGAVIALVAPLPAVFYTYGVVQAAAFLAGLATVCLVYLLARVGRSTPVTTLLLAGVALGAFASAITSFLMYVSGDKLVTVYSWLLGGFSLGSWQQLALTLPYVALGMAIIWLHARHLNVLQLDEDQAAQLGVNVERLKLSLVAASTLVTAAAVSVSGLIGFVGLIVPHAIRLLWGPDFRMLIPMCAIGGAVFLTLADTLARVVIAPAELPVGVVTAFCGAPFFLYLLRNHKRMVF